MIEAYLRAISVGVKVGQLENDASAMMTHKTKVVTGLTKRIEGFFKQNKVTYVKGAGKIVFGSKVSVDLLDGGNRLQRRGTRAGDHFVYVFKGSSVDGGGVYFEPVECGVPDCGLMGEFVPKKVVGEDVFDKIFFSLRNHLKKTHRKCS
ncbi:leghemoglobin reductase-like [Cryptomeria japonica]|uniref:leghemoglobin reductase-like n=1 Tax=Cryptomeria japonica TaxID=3369 RepID=UPI0027DA4CF8|nr:leghemoglobin reductase-like [Cryptomeria japonica]